MKDLILDIITALDGRSYAVAKVLGVLLVLVFILLEVYQVIVGKPVFDAVAYGTGGGLCLAALGTAIKLTETSEPKA